MSSLETDFFNTIGRKRTLVFREEGRHTRMAVGVSALPYNVAVEVEGVFEVDTT